MELQKHFSKLETREVPKGLFDKIMAKIALKRRRRAILSFAFSSMMLVAGAVFMVPVLLDVHAAMIQSGTYQFVSLMFSNFSEVAASWQDYVFSLFESLPILSIAAFLATVLFVLASLRFISRDVKILFYRHF